MAASSRLAALVSRYGWRTPFIVLAVAFDRWSLRQIFLFCKLLLLTRGIKGKGIRMGKDVSFSAGSDVAIGRNVHIGERSILEIYVNPSARLQIEDDAWLSHDCHLCSFGSIRIGSGVLIGEFVSIRDSTHAHTDPDQWIKDQPNIIGHITVEDNVWIGRGTLILGRPEGVVIGQGSIIAANSVVSRSIPAMEIWAGAPCRLVRKRRVENADAPSIPEGVPDEN